MTKEEAIAFFKDMNECTYGNLEAVEMAIKALEQQEQQPSDTVSRQVVKEQMIKYGFLAPDMTVTEFVEDLPSPRHTTTGDTELYDIATDWKE